MAPTSPRLIRGLVGAAGFLALGEGALRLFRVDSTTLPKPSAVLAELVRLLGSVPFLADMLATVYVWVLGLVIAVAAAIPAGIVLGSLPAVRTATRSLVEFLRPIPPVAMIPLAILLFGSNTQMKLALVVYAAVWPILFNTVYALSDVDPVAKDTARSFGFGWPTVLLRVILPSAAPFIATGIRVSASIALIVTVSAGLLAGGAAGLGTFIIEASTGTGNTDVVLAAAAVTGAMGYLGSSGLERVERGVFQWHFAHGDGSS